MSLTSCSDKAMPMSLLEFALGPGLQWSIAILLFGIGWRFIGVLLLKL